MRMQRQFLQQRKKRAWIFWIFLITAIPTAVIIVSYAAGYRIIPTKSLIVQTSALSISSIPRKAYVFINDNLQKERTPFFQDTLAPGSATIRIVKEGYHPWQKTMMFTPGRSVIFSNVLLFRQEAPVALDAARTEEVRTQLSAERHFEAPTDEMITSWNAEDITTTTPMTILQGPFTLVVSAANDSSILLPNPMSWSHGIHLSGAVRAAEWHNDEQLVYITSSELWIFSKTTKNTLLLVRSAVPLRDVAWHPDGDYLYYSTEQALYARELDPRDGRQQWKLADVNAADNLHINTKGNVLTYEAEGVFFALKLY